jgi:4-carboxymuconolactone decarboxylase
LSDDRYDDGMKVRRAVLGDAHVDRASEAITDFDKDFQEYITETVWGRVWTRPAVDRRTRSLMTLCILGALGHHEELALHIRASRNTGATKSEIIEALMHVTAYAGVPAGNRAFAIAKRTFAEMDASE